MKNTPDSSLESYLIPKFTNINMPTFYPKVYCPAHSPCWCIKPSHISYDATIFKKLIENEAEYLKKGLQLWIVGFEVEINDGMLTPFSFLLTDSTVKCPTTEQLSQLQNWYSALNFAIRTTISDFAGDNDD